MNHDKKVIKRPEWKNCLDEMRKKGIDYGGVFTSEFFEKNMRISKDEIKYSINISKIRRELEKDGYYLSGKGQNGNQYVIVQPEQNVNLMGNYQRKAIDSLNRGVILGTNTPLYLLKDGERVKHEQMLQNMATKMVLMRRGTSMVGSESLKRLK